MRKDPTYETSRAALGGAPWRDKPKSTDKWFILDSDVLPIARPRRPWLLLVGGGLALVVTAAFFGVRAFAHHPQPVAVPAVVAAPVVAAPVVAAPVAAAPAVAEPVAAPAAPAVTAPPPAKKHARLKKKAVTKSRPALKTR
jgi:hypothetical protein